MVSRAVRARLFVSSGASFGSASLRPVSALFVHALRLRCVQRGSLARSCWSGASHANLSDGPFFRTGLLRVLQILAACHTLLLWPLGCRGVCTDCDVHLSFWLAHKPGVVQLYTLLLVCDSGHRAHAHMLVPLSGRSCVSLQPCGVSPPVLVVSRPDVAAAYWRL